VHGNRKWRRSALTAAAFTCALGLVASACGDDKKSSSTTLGSSSSNATSAGSGTSQPAKPAGVLPNNGPCDAAKPPIKLATFTVIESPVLSLQDSADAGEAAVAGFNKRGGIGGRCMQLTICDSKGDPNKETACARDVVSSGAVATLNDNAIFAPDAVRTILAAAGVPRVAQNPQPADLTMTGVYSLDGGGAGTTFITVPACAVNGHKKIAAIHVDTPTIGPLFAALAPMLKAYGAELVAKIPVPAGTTDYSQFTLAAQSAGATCVMVVLGQNEAVQVLRAAGELKSSLAFSGSAASFSNDSLKSLGAVAEKMYLNGATPPLVSDYSRWPVLADLQADFDASGKANLKKDAVQINAIPPWEGVLAFTQIIEKFGDPTNVTRATVAAAVKAAKDINMYGLIPNWTPTATSPPFTGVSNPWYYVMSYKNGDFVVSDKMYNMANELAGKIDYDHNPGASTPAATTVPATAATTTAP